MSSMVTEEISIYLLSWNVEDITLINNSINFNFLQLKGEKIPDIVVIAL